MTDQVTDDRSYLTRKITDMSAWTLKGQRGWSFANNGSTILVVVFSAISAVMAQTHPPIFKNWLLLGHVRNSDFASVLSLLVTIISTVQSKLGFERKWIANRMSQSSLVQLQVDIELAVPTQTIGAKYQKIVADHDNAIIGAPTTSSTK